MMETILKLSGVAYAGSSAENFMNQMDKICARSPLDNSEFILDNCRIHCQPTDMNRGIRINDMQSMQKGAGSAALKQLCDLADEFDIPLSLTAKGFSANPSPTEVLVNWYSRFGSGMGNARDGIRMKREPKSSSAPASQVIKLRGFKRSH